MLLNLSKKSWTAGLTLTDFQQHNESNEKVVKELKSLADRYDKVWFGSPLTAIPSFTPIPFSWTSRL